ncbi:MAG: HTH-type transcriptional regulator BhcR [Pseudomonadota bacterium]
MKRPRGRPRKHPSDGENAPVQALERGLQLLSLLARDARSTLTEIALSAGMPPSTAHRLLMTLQAQRFAEFDENTQEWMIGVEAYRIGVGFLNRINLVETAQPVVHELMSATGETANLAIADEGDVVFVSQVETQNPIRAFFRPGSRSHMHVSGAGKALMAQMSRDQVEGILRKKGLPKFTETTITKPDALFADLETIAARGWSFDDEERYAGMRCIAAPVFGAHGSAVAAISVSGPTARFTDAKIAELSVAVRKAAAALTEAMGGAAPS